MKEKILNYIGFIRQEYQKMVVELRLPTMKQQFLWLLAIYLVATSSIIRANYDYADDYVRLIWGPRCWNNFDRWVDMYLSGIFHDGYYMVDITPLGQWISLLFMALAAVLLLRIFSDDTKISKWGILAVIPMGISPYFLGCLSYKFDSPYMALSVLASIFPCIFMYKNFTLFALTSLVGVMVMCNTYQASSGIYPMMVMFLSIWSYLRGKDLKRIFQWIIGAIVVYIGVLLVYKFLIVKPVLSGVSTEIAPIKSLYATVVSNLTSYTRLVGNDVMLRWRYCYFAIGIMYVLNSVANAKINKMFAFLLALLGCAFGYVLSFGVYVCLIKPGFGPRCMYAFYVYLSILATISVCSWRKLYVERVLCFTLSWMCVVFSFVYGNMLTEEHQYRFLRMTMLVSDLNKVVPRTHNGLEICFENSVRSPIVNNAIRSKYPILGRLIHGAVSSYGEKQFFMSGCSFPKLKESKLSAKDMRNMKMPVVVDSCYNTIWSNGKFALIRMHQN